MYKVVTPFKPAAKPGMPGPYPGRVIRIHSANSINTETDRAFWTTPQAALDEFADGKTFLLPPTWTQLDSLDGRTGAEVLVRQLWHGAAAATQYATSPAPVTCGCDARICSASVVPERHMQTRNIAREEPGVSALD